MRNPKKCSREGNSGCGCWSPDALQTRAGISTALPRHQALLLEWFWALYSCVTELEALQRVKGRSQVHRNVNFASLIAPRNLLWELKWELKFHTVELNMIEDRLLCLVGNWWSVMNVVSRGFPYKWFLLVPVFWLISRICFPPPTAF